MTAKYYRQLADAFKATEPQWQANGDDVRARLQWQRDMQAIATVLETNEPKFKRDLFIDYALGLCGPRGGDREKHRGYK